MKKAAITGIVLLVFFLTGVLSAKIKNEMMPSFGSCLHDSLCTAIADHPAPQSRQGITFILGTDKEPDNPYYREASNYYRYNPEGYTEYLVDSCRSLQEVMHYLATNPPANGQPWGLINLVSHGNQWLGLSVKVAPGLKRSTTDRILESISNGTLKALPDSLIDQGTEIFIHGCGIGNNPGLVKAVGLAFGGTENTPVARASKLFEYYSSIPCSGGTVESRRYYARTWHICYKMGSQPDADSLRNLFKTKYPDTKIDWEDALSRQIPRWSGDIYGYTFEVPVKFTLKRGNINKISGTEAERDTVGWINDQEEIRAMLDKIEIPAESFSWSFAPVYIRESNGNKVPAIWVKGYCTVYCIIRPLVDENQESYGLKKPWLPDPQDEEYFYAWRNE